MYSITKALAAVAFIAVSALLYGFTLQTLWGWFIVPVFAVPKLSIAQSYGILLLISFLTYRHSSDVGLSDSVKHEKLIEACAIGVIMPLMALLFGYVVQRFFL